MRFLRLGLFMLLAATCLVAAAMLALHTPTGRSFLADRIEVALGTRLSMKVEIGRIDGGLPSKATVHDIQFFDGEKAWMRIDRLDVSLRPASFLRGAPVIESVDVAGGALLARPPARQDQAAQLRLPEKLPVLEVTRLRVSNFSVDPSLVGAPLVIASEGRINSAPKSFDLRLAAESSGGRDRLTVEATRRSDEAAAALRVAIASAADGAIARLLNLGGAAFLEARGDGPLNRFAVDMHGALGDYGSLDGRIVGDLEALSSLKIEAGVEFGERFAALAAELGPRLSVAASLSAEPEKLLVQLERAAARAGVLSGDATVSLNKDLIDKIVAKGSFAPSADYRRDWLAVTGTPARLSLNAKTGPRDYSLDLSLTAPRARASLNGGATDFRTRLSGRIAAEIDPGEDRPAALRPGARGAGVVTFRREVGVTVSGLSLQRGDGLEFAGSGAVNRDGDALLEGGFRAPASALSPRLASNAPIDGRLRARREGGVTVIDLAGATPASTYRGGAIEPAKFKLAAQVDKRGTDGRFAAVGQRGRRLDLTFSRPSAQPLALRDIRYDAPGFSASGDISVGQSETKISLLADGGTGAEPWPGIRVAGEARLELRLDPDTINVDADADRLDFNRLALENARLAAHGPRSGAAGSLSVGRLSVAGMLLDQVEADSMVALADAGATSLSLQTLTFHHRNERYQSTAPAAIKVADGVAIDRLGLRSAAGGSLTVAGAYSARRWAAQIEAAGLPLNGPEETIDATISIDTDRRPTGDGSFAFVSRLTEPATRIEGDARWDGDRISLRSRSASILAFEIGAPARLRRGRSLSIDTAGALEGRIAFDGRFERIAALAPEAFQTLEGATTASFALAGTLASPQLVGEFRLVDGGYTESFSGLSLVGVSIFARAQATAEAARFDVAGAARGAGQDRDTVRLSGTAALGAGGGLDLEARLDRAALAAGPVDAIEASGVVTLKGPFRRPHAEGDLRVDALTLKAEPGASTRIVPITVVRRGEGPKDGARQSRTRADITYALRFSAADVISISSGSLQSIWRGDGALVGARDAPALTGLLTLDRGTLDFAGRRFAIREGALRFDREPANDPAVRLIADYRARGGVTASVTVSGRASRPEIRLSSVPTLPEEDVVALVMFGKPATELSASESLQTAEALAAVSGVNPFGSGGVAGAARGALGLDLLNIDLGDEDEASSLTIGKYVADRLFVSATQDARGESGSVRIEYELFDSFTVETELKQNGDQTVSGNWKLDF